MERSEVAFNTYPPAVISLVCPCLDASPTPFLLNGGGVACAPMQNGTEQNDYPRRRDVVRATQPDSVPVDCRVECLLKTPGLVRNLDSDDVP
jgi:hypothetical protein